MNGIESLTSLVSDYDRIQIHGSWVEYLAMVIKSPSTTYASMLLVVDLFGRLRRATQKVIVEDYSEPALRLSHICIWENGKATFQPVG